MIAQAIVVVSISVELLRRLPQLFPNKAWCGSSLARCRRIAVAPKYIEQCAVVGPLTTYGVTGVISMSLVRMVLTGFFNHE